MTRDAARTRGMPLDLLLVRHGQSEGNVALDAADEGDRRHITDEFRERNASDWRLSKAGRAQAKRAGRWIREWMAKQAPSGFDRYYCSPYVRTMETAALLGLPDARWQLEALVRERDFGLWAAIPKPDIPAEFPLTHEQRERHKFLWRPESGESTADLDLRVRDVLASMAREMAGRQVICVTHEDTMRAFRFRLERMTITEWIQHGEDDLLDVPNCGILHYTRRRKDGTVANKFDRVRLVDPSGDGGGWKWRKIQRRNFTNDELLEQVEAIPPLAEAGEGL